MGGSDFRPDFDERREIWRLLGHLSPQTRLAFLKRCCESVSNESVVTTITDNDGSVDSVLWDLLTLCWDRGGNIQTVGERLVEWVRRYGAKPGTKDRGPSIVHRTTPAEARARLILPTVIA